MTTQAIPEPRLSFEEQRKLAAKVPNAEEFYNRISIEHDIPLPVAEAMLRFAGIFTCQMIASKESERELYGLSALFAAMWIGMAPTMNIPEARMQAAIKDAINGAIAIAKKSNEVVKEHLREQEAQVAA